METRIICPLGSECESAKDGYIERCAWYVEMRGTDASGKDHNTWRCAIAWQPILQVEASGMTRQVVASVQSLRNETVKRQDIALKSVKVLSDAKNIISK